MNDLRKELLAYPAFAGHQYRKIGRSDPQGYFEGAVQTFVVTDDPETLFYGR